MRPPLVCQGEHVDLFLAALKRALIKVAGQDRVAASEHRRAGVQPRAPALLAFSRISASAMWRS